MSDKRFEIVGLTKAEVDRCMEVLCGGPVPWDRGYCFASSELFARPSRYGPADAPPAEDWPSEAEANAKLAATMIGAAGKHAERVVELEAEVSTLRESLAEVNRLLSLHVAEVERLRARIAELEKLEEPIRQVIDYYQKETKVTTVASTSDERTVNNVMRHAYRVLSDEEKSQMQALKDKGLELHQLIESIGKSRELSLALTKTEEAVMWGVKHITR